MTRKANDERNSEMQSARNILARALCLLLVMTGLSLHAWSSDLSSSYAWKPVRIGAGGWVVGMVLHPQDATVRYLRTDVGNAYRWDNNGQQWIPMRAANADGSGVQSASEIAAPSVFGEDSIAVDPALTNVVYMVFPTLHSCDVQCPSSYVQIYKSTDGGANFTPGNLLAASVKGDPNGAHRMYGERLMVDPANSSVLYYASDSQGVFRTMDGGATWTQVAGVTSLPANLEFLNILFAKAPGTISVNGVTVSKVLYAVSINNNKDAGGDVYQSQDGGQTWQDISTGVKDNGSGQSLGKQALGASIDSTDALYVPENSSTNGSLRAYWRYAASQWTRVSLEGFISQPLVSVVADPVNPQRIYALAMDTSMSRSDNGGQNWINLGSAQYANTLGWLPQTIGMTGGGWRSNGGLKFDAQGNLWTPTGQEGALTLASANASAATAANPPQWTIVSTGIEEQVAQDIVVPPGSNDTLILTAEDTTGFVVSNPDNFSATQIPLQQEIIAQGTSVDYIPDVPSYIAVTSSNVYTNGPNYSGYSVDGGQSWKSFGAAIQVPCGSSKCDTPAGNIAVSVRGSRSLGADHIVIYPPNNLAPQYSQDGGKTWHVTTSFPLRTDGVSLDTTNFNSFPIAELQQRLLRADPFTADRFYLKFTHAPSSFYISTDGGQTWQGQAKANLPDQAWHSQLVVNPKLKNDIWFASGWEGASTPGIFRSTDGGQSFQQVQGIAHGIVMAIGASSGQPGDAPYTVYFYGKLASDANWGVFRSTNGGNSWDRVAYYPTGIYDKPNTMGASLDSFGKVYIGFSGNSFVYGQQMVVALPAAPAAPSALTATPQSDAEIDLSWTAPSGAVSSYSIYRGTSSGQQAATPLATGVQTTSYKDTGLTRGTSYFYTVQAVNSGGASPQSSEASALALQPAIALGLASGGSSTATVSKGSTATFALLVTPANYAGSVTFACSGAPAGYLCTVPAPITFQATSNAAAVSVTVQTAANSARLDPRRSTVGSVFALALLLMPFGFLRRRGRVLLAGVLSILVLCAANGCGGSGGAASTGSGSSSPVVSTLTVTATGVGVPSTSQTLIVTAN